MKAIIYSVLTILLVSAFSSCGKDDVMLVASEYKNRSISCGLDFEIPVLASNSRFDIKGTCMQISPLTKTLIISD